MVFLIKHLQTENKERIKLLVQEGSGLPLFYPTLYVTSHIRGLSLSISTIQNFLTSIKVMYACFEFYKIDIEDRFKNGFFLKLNEVISLRDFTKKSLTALNSNNKYTKKVEVSSSTQYSRLTSILYYLEFLAKLLNLKSECKNCSTEIEAMINQIKSHRPTKNSRTDDSRIDKTLDMETISKMMDILTPGNIDNPFENHDIQVRNGLIITILKFHGIRRGELLNICIDDIDFSKNELKIVRRADSKNDLRSYQPLVKTEERTLYISDLLSKYIHDYIIEIRNKFKFAKTHPYLFVTHKEGVYCGYPLSNSTFGKMINQLQNISDEYCFIHAHAFRHTWNYEFSHNMDKSKKSSECEEQIRSFLMGWSGTSGTAAIYNKRHIKEKAKDATLQFQKKFERNISG